MTRICHAWSSDLRIPESRNFEIPLHARGFEVVYATPPGPNATAAVASGVAWREFPMTRRMDPLGDARGLVQLTRLFARERFDLVHTHNAKVGLVGRLAATAARVPVLVHTVHGFPFHADETAKREAYVVAERIANVRTDAIFTQSDEDTETLTKLRVIDPSKIVFVGNGVSLERFDPARFDRDAGDRVRRSLGIAAEEILFVCAARLRHDKGVVELIDAAIAARMRDPRIRLALAGEPDVEGRDAVSESTLRMAVEAGVLRLGRVEDIPALYAAADVITLPSWHEGLPRALVEGAAMGKPLLTTDVPGCREVARAPMHGRVVPVRDANSLRIAMESLAADSGLRREAATVNRREAVRRFDVRNAAERIAATYDTLLAARGCRTSTPT